MMSWGVARSQLILGAGPVQSCCAGLTGLRIRSLVDGDASRNHYGPYRYCGHPTIHRLLRLICIYHWSLISLSSSSPTRSVLPIITAGGSRAASTVWEGTRRERYDMTGPRRLGLVSHFRLARFWGTCPDRGAMVSTLSCLLFVFHF
jgi:hypothetical protein